MINDDEKDLGILFLSILNSKSTIEECIKKSGLTADKISNLISIPKFNKYFEKETNKELHITCKIDWICEDIGNLIKISDSESKILKETIDKKFLNHVTKYWEENGRIKRDFEI